MGLAGATGYVCVCVCPLMYLGDVDFQKMIQDYVHKELPEEEAHNKEAMRLKVVVRKRPISQAELDAQEFDALSIANPLVIVHNSKYRVDGIGKYLENHRFEVDHAFHADVTTQEVYKECSFTQLVNFAMAGGRSTCFAYGQTGSGKTYTMNGIEQEWYVGFVLDSVLLSFSYLLY